MLPVNGLDVLPVKNVDAGYQVTRPVASKPPKIYPVTSTVVVPVDPLCKIVGVLQ